MNDASHSPDEVKLIGPTWPAHDNAVSSWCSQNSVILPTFTMTAVFLMQLPHCLAGFDSVVGRWQCLFSESKTFGVSKAFLHINLTDDIEN